MFCSLSIINVMSKKSNCCFVLSVLYNPGSTVNFMWSLRLLGHDLNNSMSISFFFFFFFFFYIIVKIKVTSTHHNKIKNIDTWT